MRKSPLLIRILNYFFIYMGVVSIGILAVAWGNPSASSRLSVSFLTNQFLFDQNPILFTVTCLFFVFSGITGLAIVFRRSFAYDLGIAYCICSLIFFTALIILKMGLINGQTIGIAGQFLLFGSLLVYLARNRSQWKTPNQR